MVAQLIRVYQGAPGATETMAYQVATGHTLTLLAIRIANTTGSAQTASVSLVPSSGSAGAGNRIIPAQSIAANDVLADSDTHVVPAGHFISVKASDPGVTFTISGALQ